jgi:tripartite ATP-independent transporter DctM subunit
MTALIVTIVIALAILVGLLVAGAPIFVGFLAVNIIGVLYYFGPSGFGLFANSIFTTATIDALAAVPLFIVMGDLLFRSGAMEGLFSSLDRLVGRVRGRQYVLCILLSAILGALSGAAMAVAGLLGRSLYPTMIRRGYDAKLSAGTILGGASLDPIIPPSVLAVILAIVAQISTGKLLIAGLGPGILLTVMFLVYVGVRLWVNPALAPDVSPEEHQKKGSALLALIRMLPACFIFFLVMGLVMLGIATPTEAAATGVFGALGLSYFYGGLTKSMLRESFYTGVTVSSLLLLIMSCAVMFSQLLTFAGAPQLFGEMVRQLQLPVAITLCIMLALPFLLHILLFLDQIALFFILVPIYKPILAVYGVDEIWFFTMLLIVATVGGISPPFGYTIFAMKSALPNSSMAELYRAAWPFVWIICLGIVIIAIFPGIATWLPNLMGPRQ